MHGKQTTPVLKNIPEDTGKFAIDLATTRPKGGDMSTFHPDSSAYALAVSTRLRELGQAGWWISSLFTPLTTHFQSGRNTRR